MEEEKENLRTNEIERNYSKLVKLGEGTYGIVFKAVDKRSGKVVALKRIKMEHEEEGVPASALREVAAVRELRHPNIVRLFEMCCSRTSIYMIFEYSDMDLRAYIRQSTDISESLVVSMVYQLVQAIECCHAHGILHRDLKPQNILVNMPSDPSHPPILKLADFGLARAFTLPIRVYTHEVITLWYRPPEIFLGHDKYSLAVDIWSVGCVMGELAFRNPLFPGSSELDTLFKIMSAVGTPTSESWPGVERLKEWRHQFPKFQGHLFRKYADKISQEGMDLLLRLLSCNPADRPNAAQILKTDYLKQCTAVSVYGPRAATNPHIQKMFS